MDLHNRRAFLRAAAAAGVAWTAADLLSVEDALVWAADQTATERRGGFTVLSAADADALEAMTSRIIPSVDGRPGAREAGVVFFIDKALATFNASQRKTYASGVQDLNRRSVRRWPEAASFSSLPPARQDEMLRDIEKTPFFQVTRFDTIVGMFALPSWGGNRDYAGWHLIGLEHRPRFEPPFGEYDAEVNGRK